LKRLYPDQPIVGIGIVIIKDGEIALIKRGNQPALGKWTVPGGIVEIGESLEAAVVREAKEETCLTVEAPHLLGVVDQIDRDEEGKIKYHYVILDYLVHVVDGAIAAASDAAELRWVKLNEVEDYDLTASFRRFFRSHRFELEKAESYR
jgi:ADP-ribose pyrophosphatase YjhB (NUDIX family)